MKIKLLSLLTICAITTACSDIPDKLNNRILFDKEGCAFIVKKNVGDTVFLSFIKDSSKDSCKFRSEDN
ncbi:hypothetical protein D3C85_392600 [compost metagenome]